MKVFCQLDGLTWIDVAGKDAVRVLNNLCTADLNRLEIGRGTETFVTDVRGRTLGHLCAYRMDDRVRLLGAPGQASALLAHIDRYIIREDAAPAAVDAQWAAYWLATDQAAAALAAPDGSLPTAEAPALACGNATMGALAVDAYQVPWTTPHDHLLVVDAAQTAALRDVLLQSQWRGVDDAAFHRRRIEHRFPWFGVDLDEGNLPQEADRDRFAISFTKGCYLGQETVARLDALGQVQKKLLRWRIEGQQPPPPGTELRAGERVVGRITSACPREETGDVIALGYGRRSHFDAGSEAEFDGVRAVVLAGE